MSNTLENPTTVPVLAVAILIEALVCIADGGCSIYPPSKTCLTVNDLDEPQCDACTARYALNHASKIAGDAARVAA